MREKTERERKKENKIEKERERAREIDEKEREKWQKKERKREKGIEKKKDRMKKDRPTTQTVLFTTPFSPSPSRAPSTVLTTSPKSHDSSLPMINQLSSPTLSALGRRQAFISLQPRTRLFVANGRVDGQTTW